MTNEQLIELMRGELYDNRWCQNDFENYDVKTLAKTSEPFFWLVRESGTGLSVLSLERIQMCFQNEADRIEIMRDNYAIISSILYWNDYECKNKYFYWDGYAFQKIQAEDVKEIFWNIYGNAITDMISAHPEENAIKDAPLSVEYASEDARRYMEEMQKDAQKLGTTSLDDCVKSLTRWRRSAVNHKIVISRDFADKSFFFSEQINDKPHICGGIIFSNNKWSIHT